MNYERGMNDVFGAMLEQLKTVKRFQESPEAAARGADYQQGLQTGATLVAAFVAAYTMRTAEYQAKDPWKGCAMGMLIGDREDEIEVRSERERLRAENAKMLEREPLVQAVIRTYQAYLACALEGREDPSNEEAAVFDALCKLAEWKPR